MASRCVVGANESARLECWRAVGGGRAQNAVTMGAAAIQSRRQAQAAEGWGLGLNGAQSCLFAGTGQQTGCARQIVESFVAGAGPLLLCALSVPVINVPIATWLQ